MVLPCGADLINVGNQDLVVAASDKRGEAGAVFVIPPGDTQVLHNPPSGLWVLNVLPARAVSGLRTDAAVLGLGILVLAVYGGIKAVEAATNHPRR